MRASCAARKVHVACGAPGRLRGLRFANSLSNRARVSRLCACRCLLPRCEVTYRGDVLLYVNARANKKNAVQIRRFVFTFCSTPYRSAHSYEGCIDAHERLPGELHQQALVWFFTYENAVLHTSRITALPKRAQRVQRESAKVDSPSVPGAKDCNR